MKRLFFVRHGESEHNVNRVWSGQTETVLTQKGRAQAKETAKNLKLRLPRIDLVICSPYARTDHTARIIAEEIGYPVEKIEHNNLLIERSFGVLEGTSSLGYYDTHKLEDVDKEESAETIEELQKRAARAFQYLQSLDYDNILVVSHGSFGRALIRVIKKMPHTDEFIDERRESLRLGNAEIVELI